MTIFHIDPQPTDSSGGATGLHAIYRYYGRQISLKTVMDEVGHSQSGGTLAPLLGTHALHQGFDVTMYVHNLYLFDPSWFKTKKTPSSDFLLKKLVEQRAYQEHTPALQEASTAFETFLKAGGQLRFQVLTSAIFKHYLTHEIPILTGLSATYLYGIMRERAGKTGASISDDIGGQPVGHFVVLYDYVTETDTIAVADPLVTNPISHDNYYSIPVQQLLNAILLGVYTFDANVMVIQPKQP